MWNNLFAELKLNKINMFAINISGNEDITKKLIFDKSLFFPVINGQEYFSKFLGVYKNAQIITIVLKSDLIIQQVHISFFHHSELTKEFCNNLIESIKKDYL